MADKDVPHLCSYSILEFALKDFCLIHLGAECSAKCAFYDYQCCPGMVLVALEEIKAVSKDKNILLQGAT